MRIAGTRSFSTVNGPGVRYTIFVQGCLHRCEDCHNPGTWDMDGGEEMRVEDICWDIGKHPMIDGITLSGGEPFLQQAECVRLLEMLPDTMSVWIYTGFRYEDICDTKLAQMADFIVDGRFEKDKSVEGYYYGSSNQRIIDVKKGLIYNHGEFQSEL